MCKDGIPRKKITVSVLMSEKEINEANAQVKQSYHKDLKAALTTAINNKLLALWEDYGTEEAQK